MVQTAKNHDGSTIYYYTGKWLTKAEYDKAVAKEKAAAAAKTTSSSSSSSSSSKSSSSSSKSSSSSTPKTTTAYKTGDVVGGVAVGTVKPNTGGQGNVIWDGKSWSATTKPLTSPTPTPTNALMSAAPDDSLPSFGFKNTSSTGPAPTQTSPTTGTSSGAFGSGVNQQGQQVNITPTPAAPAASNIWDAAWGTATGLPAATGTPDISQTPTQMANNGGGYVPTVADAAKDPKFLDQFYADQARDQAIKMGMQPNAPGAGALPSATMGSPAGAVAPAVAAAGLDLGGLVVPGAIVAGGLIGAIGSNKAAETQATASAEAAKIQADAALAAGQITKDMYDKWLEQSNNIYQQSRADLEPWRQAGIGALDGLKNFDAANPGFQVDPFKFETSGANADPSYTFRFNEGLKALQNSAAARGSLLSGNTMKGITQYGQDAASQEYSNAFNRYQTDTANKFNRFQTQRGMKLNAMQSLAGVGQSAVHQMNTLGQNQSNSTGQASQNTAGQMGGAYTGAANAMANGMTGAADARASGWMGAANAATGSLSTWLNYNNSNNMTNAMMAMMGR